MKATKVKVGRDYLLLTPDGYDRYRVIKKGIEKDYFNSGRRKTHVLVRRIDSNGMMIGKRGKHVPTRSLLDPAEVEAEIHRLKQARRADEAGLYDMWTNDIFLDCPECEEACPGSHFIDDTCDERWTLDYICKRCRKALSA